MKFSGSHEARVYYAVDKVEGTAQPDIMVRRNKLTWLILLYFFVVEQKQVPNAKVGFSKAMSNGWLKIDKSSGSPLVMRQVMVGFIWEFHVLLMCFHCPVNFLLASLSG